MLSMRWGAIPVAVSVLLLAGCEAKLSLTARATEDQPEFILKTRRVNGILDITLWSNSSGEYLWALKGNYSKVGRVKYGQVPSDMRQVYPHRGGKPRRLQAGETLVVAVGIQYDTIAAASVGTWYFQFRVSEGNVLEEVIPPEPRRYPEGYPILPPEEPSGTGQDGANADR